MRKTQEIPTQGRIPDTMYKILPYFYLCAGIAAICLANSGMAVFSGVALITAGIIVWVARLQNRTERLHRKNLIDEQKAAAEESSDSTMKIHWRRSFESGHAVIDEQHRNLFLLGNRLINMILNHEHRNEVQLLLIDIIKHIDEHFSTEESILAAIHHPITESHKQTHNVLSARIEEVSDQFQKGQLPPRELVGFIMYDLITDHLMKEDIDFFEGLRAKTGRTH
jgi:hemerythrin-like metal-binding protein